MRMIRIAAALALLSGLATVAEDAQQASRDPGPAAPPISDTAPHAGPPSGNAEPNPREETVPPPPTFDQVRVQQLKDLRWGMFVCWSFSTFSGKEWTPGVTNIDLFAATEVDTDQWAETAKKAGMGYILFLTKHHDGFCLWDTKTTDRKVTKAKLGRDVLAELRKSCDKYGIKLALYFSEGEWAWPDRPTGGRYQNNGGYNPEMKKAQLRELLTQYGPIEYIWFDHAVGDGGLSHDETTAFCKALQPGCFIGYNHGPPSGDIRLGEMGHPSPLTDESGAGFNSGHMKGYAGYRLAEFTYPILPKHAGGAQWFYSLPKHDALCMPAAKLYRDYVGAVRCGNIFSADVGPDYRGRLREIDVKTLEQVGEMIRNPPPAPPAAKASSTWNAPGYEAEMGVDGDESTRWGAAPGARRAWLEVDLGEPKVIGRAVVMELEFPRTQKFALEYKGREGDSFTPIVTGTTLAGRRVFDFPPIKARYFRLNILEADEVPTIEEFQVYPEGTPLPASTAAKPEAVERWKDMRFGMFICWGPVTLTGREIGWSRGAPTPVEEYDNLYKKWNPTNFDARAWAKVVKDTGCKYVVFLTKHHDGFCLFDTAFTDYNIMNGPFKRDVTKELADACRDAGIGFFPYYSTCDWHHPDFPATSPGGRVKRETSNLDRYTEYLEAQTKELITRCGPLIGIWFDVPQHFDRARGERVIRHVRALQPDILVNNRTGAPGDFDTPEQTVGRCQFNRPWESCITLGTQWTWKPNDTIKPWSDAVRILVSCAVGDGNLALNTNPMPDGQIEPRQVDNFKKIGSWLSQYGESIYGTRGGPFVAPGTGAVQAQGGGFQLPGGAWWGGSTRKGNVIYLHILRWPADAIALPAIGPRIAKHSVLTGGEATVTQSDAGISVTLPPQHRDAVDTIIKLELDAPAGGIQAGP